MSFIDKTGRVGMCAFLRAVLVIMIGSSVAASQNSSIIWSALDMGFAAPASATTELRSISGQVIVGATLSSATLIESGFLAGFSFSQPISGPVIIYSRGGTPEGTVWMASTDGAFDTMLFAGSWPHLSHNGKYILCHKGTNGTPERRSVYLHYMETGQDSLFWSNVGDYANYYDWSNNDSIVVLDFDCYLVTKERQGGHSVQWPTGDCNDDAPSFKPGSWTVAFHNSFTGILLMDSLGANRRHVPNTVGGDFWPTWSPSGEWIAYGRWSTGLNSIQNFFKIHPDGSNLTPLTDYTASDSVGFAFGGLAWTPDGSKILVAGSVHGVNGIYAIATDGSKRTARVPISPGDPVDHVGSVTGNVNISLTGVPERDGQLPVQFRLDQNYPNPFNPSTTINYQLPATSHVALKIYSILGQEVATLLDRVEAPGYKSVVWNSQNVASGVYFLRIVATSGQTTFTDVRKMIVMK